MTADSKLFLITGATADNGAPAVKVRRQLRGHPSRAGGAAAPLAGNMRL
jgi:hypothetical protein